MKRNIVFLVVGIIIFMLFLSCNNSEKVISSGQYRGYPVSLVYNSEEKDYRLRIDCSDNDSSLYDRIELYVDSFAIAKVENMDLDFLLLNQNVGTITAKNGAKFKGLIFAGTFPTTGMWSYPDSTHEYLYSPEDRGEYYCYIRTFDKNFSEYNGVIVLIPSEMYSGIGMHGGIEYFEKSHIAAFEKKEKNSNYVDVVKYNALSDWKIDSTTCKPIISIFDNSFEAFFNTNERLSIGEINEIFNWMAAYYQLLDLHTLSKHSYIEEFTYFSDDIPVLVDSDCYDIQIDIPWKIRRHLFKMARDLRKPLGNDIADMFENQVWFKDKLSYYRSIEQYLRYDIRSSMPPNGYGTIECKEWIRCKLQILIPENQYNSYYYNSVRQLVSYNEFIRFLADICLNDLLVQVSRERDRMGDSSYMIS